MVKKVLTEEGLRYLIKRLREDERNMACVPKICVNCCAPLDGYVCEYCGTEYTAQPVRRKEDTAPKAKEALY